MGRDNVTKATGRNVLCEQGFHFVNGSLLQYMYSKVLYVICVITAECKLVEQS